MQLNGFKFGNIDKIRLVCENITKNTKTIPLIGVVHFCVIGNFLTVNGSILNYYLTYSGVIYKYFI